jgi:hypothetical protein
MSGEGIDLEMLALNDRTGRSSVSASPSLSMAARGQRGLSSAMSPTYLDKLRDSNDLTNRRSCQSSE